MTYNRDSSPARKRISSHVVSSTSSIRPISDNHQSVSSSRTKISVKKKRALSVNKKGKKVDSRLLVYYAACVVFLMAVLFVLSTPPFKRTTRHQKTCVFTVSAINNFGFVLNLYDSVMTNSPSIDCFLWFMGDDPDPKSTKAKQAMIEIKKEIRRREKLTMVTLEDMEISLDNFHYLPLAFMYDLVELQTTIKPFAFQYVLQHFGADSAIYLDNDIWVTGSFEELQDQLSKYSVVVTPHVTSPAPLDELHLENKIFLLSGIFNFGFVAFSNTVASSKFLDFWANHLAVYGYRDPAQGMFFDQNWGNFVPVFFERDDHLILRDHRYNIAYWNLHERGAGLHMKDGLPHIENPLTKEAEKAVFVHFSGTSALENYDINGISRYQTRYTIKDFPRMRDVIVAYMERLKLRNTMHYRYSPYGFNQYSNGVEITPVTRKRYASAALEASFPPADRLTLAYGEEFSYSPYLRFWFRHYVDWKNPFCASKECLTDATKQTFLQWSISSMPDRPVDLEGPVFFSTLEKNIWDSRPDLQAAFPDPIGSSHVDFKVWIEDSVLREGLIDEKMYQVWSDTWKYHKENESKCHKHVQSSDDIGVNVYGWHGGIFGIGAVAPKLYHSAKWTSLSVSAVEAPSIHGPLYISPAELGIDLTRSLCEAVNIVAMNAPETGQYFTDQVPEVMRGRKYNIGYWNWELDVLPADWMTFLKDFDEVWVPSRFIKLALESTPGYDGTIVQVVPIPQDTEDDKKTGDKDVSKVTSITGDDRKETLSKLPLGLNKKLGSNASKPFVFLVVFDFGSTTQRKNPSASIRAFLDAFPRSIDQNGEKHQLIMKSHSGTYDQLDELKKIAKNDPRVIFIDSVISREENHALHKYQDCHISLHRSEGYGMNILESMASGVPVIATNYSGNTMFFEDMPNLEDKCTFPVSYKLVEINESNGAYTKGNHWAEPDHNSAVQAMRKASKNECKKSGLGREMMKQVHDLYGPVAVGEKMKTLLIEALPRIKEKTKPY